MTRKRILVLEDDWLVAETLKDDLQSMGHVVLGPAHNCTEALEVLLRERPDLALLDTHLGQETCEVVVDECKLQGVPIVICSAYPEGLLPDFCADLLAVSKPYTRNLIAAAVG